MKQTLTIALMIPVISSAFAESASEKYDSKKLIDSSSLNKEIDETAKSVADVYISLLTQTTAI